MKNYAVLCAGGTAGHINSAIAIGEVLKENEYTIQNISGERYLDKKLFLSSETWFIKSRPLRSKNIFIILKNLFLNFYSLFFIIFKFIVKRPKFVLGAGGYVCGPSLLAAWILGIPIYIVEQNAFAGLTNKILAKISKLIFVHFENTKGFTKNNKIRVCGNPVRNSIKFSPQNVDHENLKILVFGGSLGAKQINEAIFKIVEGHKGRKISIFHQVGKNNKKSISCSKEIVSYKQVEYIDDMQEAYKWSNLIIARSGASSVSEIRIIRKPAFLIPYPAATDNHQYFNALELKKENKFQVEILDNTLSSKELALTISKMIENVELNNNSVAGSDIEASVKIVETIEKCLE